MVVVNQSKLYCRIRLYRWIIDVVPVKKFAVWAPLKVGLGWTIQIYGLVQI